MEGGEAKAGGRLSFKASQLYNAFTRRKSIPPPAPLSPQPEPNEKPNEEAKEEAQPHAASVGGEGEGENEGVREKRDRGGWREKREAEETPHTRRG